jgi:hypothetical protein
MGAPGAVQAGRRNGKGSNRSDESGAGAVGEHHRSGARGRNGESATRVVRVEETVEFRKGG